LLELFLRRPGEVVSRDQIKAELWGDDHFVEADQGVSFCIKQLRKALGDTATGSRLLETLPRRGYRFLAPVREDRGRDEACLSRPLYRRIHLRPWLISVAAGALLLGLAGSFVHSGGESVKVGVLPPDAEDKSKDPVFSAALVKELATQLGRVAPGRMRVVLGGQEGRDGRQGWSPILAPASEVDYYLHSSVYRSGARVRVNLQLVRSSDGTQVWAAVVDRTPRDVLEFQAEIGHAVARRLAAGLQGANGSRLVLGSK